MWHGREKLSVARRLRSRPAVLASSRRNNGATDVMSAHLRSSLAQKTSIYRRRRQPDRWLARAAACDGGRADAL